MIQQDAVGDTPLLSEAVIATDPPYYDNIGYADLSDFFYVWQRRALFNVWPDLFRRMLTPKEEELVATPPSSRRQGCGGVVFHGGDEPGTAQHVFVDGRPQRIHT